MIYIISTSNSVTKEVFILTTFAEGKIPRAEISMYKNNVTESKRISLVSIALLLMTLGFFLSASAQKIRSRNDTRPRQLSEDNKFRKGTFREIAVCDGQALINTSGEINISVVQQAFKAQDFPIMVRKISDENIYLFKSIEKRTTTELFEVFSKISEKLSKSANVDAPLEPDLLVFGGPPGPSTGSAGSVWGIGRVGVQEVRDRYKVYGNDKMVIAVMDSGIHVAHPFLRDNIWKAKKAYTVRGIRCDPPDSYGFNFVTSGGTPCFPWDDEVNSHGTSVSGIIGAKENGTNPQGILRPIQLMTIKVLNSENQGCSSNIIEGIEFIVEMKRAINDEGKDIRIINASFGTFPGVIDATVLNSFSTIIQKAGTKNILIVAAAGNESVDISLSQTKPPNHVYPASFELDNVIAVSASTRMPEELVPLSNYGNKTMNLAAPGENILTTNGYDLPAYYYHTFGNTSAATPFVSASAGLLMTVCTGLNNKQVKELLLKWGNKTNFTDIGSVPRGRLDVYKAIQEAAKITGSKCKTPSLIKRE